MGLAVVVEVHDRNLFGEVEQRANVIAMVVRRPHVIDLLHARGFQRVDNAAEIAIASVARVYKEGLACGADKKGRLATLGMDEIDIKAPSGSLGQHAHEPRSKQNHGHKDSSHSLVSCCELSVVGVMIFVAPASKGQWR